MPYAIWHRAFCLTHLMTKQNNRLGLPNLGYGLGLRSKHLQHILEHGPEIDWFEIISENFIGNYGYPRHALDQIREQTPIVMHGVSMSIGSTDPLNFHYLKELKALADELKPVWLSDHLCWTGAMGINSHDLLPLPLTEESFYHVRDRINQVQEYLERPLILENPSSYMEWTASSINEWDFLAELTNETDCGLLLDLNNIYVSSRNHGFDPETYIRSIPLDKVVQIHLAGPTDYGEYLVDTHDHPVPKRVWQLYALFHSLAGDVSTMIEWDAEIPDYPELVAELRKTQDALAGIYDDPSMAPLHEGLAVSTPIDHQLANQHEPT